MNYIHYYLYVYYKAKQTNKIIQPTNKQQHRVCGHSGSKQQHLTLECGQIESAERIMERG